MLTWLLVWAVYVLLCGTTGASVELRWLLLTTRESRNAALTIATASLAAALVVRAVLLRGVGARSTRRLLLATAWLLGLTSACAGALACASVDRLAGVILLAAAGFALAATPPKIVGDVANR
jgi:hypothetical protein